MNFRFLDPDKSYPSYFKLIGTVIVAICLALGFYLKFSSSETIFNLTTKSFRSIYFAALAVIVISKSRIEDERSEELRLQIVNFGYRMLLGLFFIVELGDLSEDQFGRYGILYFAFTSVLGLQIILLALFQYSHIIDLIEKNKTSYEFVLLVLLAILYFFNRWLWSI